MSCPMCKGEGGEYDAVLWYGTGGGAYYECNYCSGDGVVSFAKFLYWHIVIIFWEEVVHKFWRNLTKRAADLLYRLAKLARFAQSANR